MLGDCPGGMGGFGIDWYIMANQTKLWKKMQDNGKILFHEPETGQETFLNTAVICTPVACTKRELRAAIFETSESETDLSARTVQTPQRRSLSEDSIVLSPKQVVSLSHTFFFKS